MLFEFDTMHVPSPKGQKKLLSTEYGFQTQQATSPPQLIVERSRLAKRPRVLLIRLSSTTPQHQAGGSHVATLSEARSSIQLPLRQ